MEVIEAMCQSNCLTLMLYYSAYHVGALRFFGTFAFKI